MDASATMRAWDETAITTSPATAGVERGPPSPSSASTNGPRATRHTVSPVAASSASTASSSPLASMV